jgi:leucyl aminopeptidase
MKINFKNLTSIVNKNSVSILILSEEEVKSTKIAQIKNATKNFDFSGKFGQIQSISLVDEVIYLCGIGAKKEIDDKILQKIGAKISAAVSGLKASSACVFYGVAIDEKGKISGKNKTNEVAELAFGALLQSYRFNKYFEDKKKDKELKVEEITFFSVDKVDFKEYEILANNVFLARDLVSEPSNVLNPESYAEICKSFKKDGLEVEVLGEKEMQKLGMNALLGVGQGSRKESKLVIFKHNGGKKGEQPIAFVGKGVTFDTGGISIKPSNNMEDMKTDMGGSAVVVSLLRNLAQRKAKVNAIGVVGLVENMPDGNAQRPGDVVKSMSGQTIEIINTDAEGRLVLADALHYTNTKFKPKFIVDLATLTGAVIVSLADIHAGLFANDDDLAVQLENAGKATMETVWRLPLGKEFDDMINSDIADMKNVGAGRGAGSTTAAQFLQRFIGETKWAHLDIAGVAWKGKGDAMAVKGATGYGVRLLDRLVRDNYEK